MPQLPLKIGFIGAGNMGEAMIGALIRSGAAHASQIYIHEIRKDRADSLQNTYGITALAGNEEIVKACHVIVFAVKPQSLDEVLSNLKKSSVFQKLPGRKIIISIAAGAKIAKYENHIYSSLDEHQKSRIPILRAMPNTPATVGAGISGLCANSHSDINDIEAAKTILLAMGKVIECEEKDMDAITAMSGSGPAYCFYIMEAMIEAGIRLGFTPETAADLTITTFKGALLLLENQLESPAQLRRNVTSPGGTTEAAINELDGNDVKGSIINAIIAAALRSKQLSA